MKTNETWEPSGRTGGLRERDRGLSMIEVAISLSLLGLILVGVLGSLSTGFMAQRNNSDILECQLLTQRVIEEVQGSEFDSLPSFNGKYVEDTAHKHRARIYASMIGMNLVQLEVETASLVIPQNSARAVTLVSNPE